MVVIKDDIKKLGLIDPSTFCEDCLEEASYELRLGDHFFLCRSQDHESKYNQFSSDRIANIEIPPFGSMYIETEEIIDLSLSTEIVARFDLRIEYALKGLLLQVGPQVKPGYRGRLFGNLFNTSSSPVKLRWKERIMEIEFSYLSKQIDLKESKEYLDLDSFFDKYGIIPSDKSVPSLFDKMNVRIDQTNARFDDCDNKHTKHFGVEKEKNHTEQTRLNLNLNKISLIVASISFIMMCIFGYHSCSSSSGNGHKINNNAGVVEKSPSSRSIQTDTLKTREKK
ncbi:MAG: hypothetical protein PHR55_01710 [Bacilli bacterium]|nr:hypothetical protein [Bacilli bacterium]